jgi:RHS repeat-associated protein
MSASEENVRSGYVFVRNMAEVFSYDLDGNMTSDGRWNYTWDAENRLIKVESRPDTPSSSWRRIEWTYDALGRRIQQVTSIWTNNAWFVVENLKFVSDPMLFGRHIVELNATNNTLVRSYVWGLDLSGTMDSAGGVGGLAWVTLHATSGSASGTQFVCYDGNGNIIALISATTGDVTARYEYGPFGEPIRISGPAASLNPFRFSTKRTDNNTDLVLYEYRAYSPSLGRLPNRDPIGELGGLNLYGFIGNNPVNYFDMWGLIDCAALKRQIEQGFKRFNRDSDLLRGFLNNQYDALGDLYWIDRAVDTAFSLTGNLASKAINAARIALTSEQIMQGVSLGVDLARGGVLTGPGLSAGASYQTAGIGGSIAGPLASKAIGSGLNSAVKQLVYQWTTSGVRNQLQDTINQLNSDLNQQRRWLRYQINQYNKCCK